MVGGLWRGLEHGHAAKFAFLLATPAILGAGLVETRTLLPFAVYSLIAGIASMIRFC